MTVKATALDDVIVAVVAALNGASLSYPVYDGPTVGRPGRSINKYVCIGLEDIPAEDGEATIGAMDQTWYGLGQKAKNENISIDCISVGKATSAASARSLAIAAVQDVSDSLVALRSNSNTLETYNALVSAVSAARVRATSGGFVVIAQFTISAQARLT